MKPRIFISSTFYDLKYIREDLANFVRAYDYEPILFEDGDIGYTPGKNLDKSCYEAMKNSDMVILIIGGEYGSAASGEKKDDFKEYMSITRNEFRTAIEAGIPIFVMIDKKVMTEYGVYEANYDSIENENHGMRFPTTKNINVFRFIKEIKGMVSLPIQEFERSSDIKGFISKQWADMFKNYLSSLRIEKENKKIENSVNEMKALIQKMDIMLDSVGKNVLAKDNPEEYDEVISQQEILSFSENLSKILLLKIDKKVNLDNINVRKEIITQILEIVNKINEENLWEGFENDDGKVDKICTLFYNMGYELRKLLGTPYSKDIDYKYVSLSNKRNIDKIVEILIQDKYFRRLVTL